MAYSATTTLRMTRAGEIHIGVTALSGTLTVTHPHGGDDVISSTGAYIIDGANGEYTFTLSSTGTFEVSAITTNRGQAFGLTEV